MEERLVPAFEQLNRGRFHQSTSLLDLAGPYRPAIQYARWLAGIEKDRPALRIEDQVALATQGELSARLLVRRWVIACAIDWDPALLRLDIPDGPGVLSAARAFQAVMAGGSPPTVDAGSEESPDHPALTVDSVVLRGLGSLASGDLDEARTAVRRAVRMSRTESLPQSQYLAGVALARYRRLAGHPHLALRIIRGLAAVVPSPWRRWVSWEAVAAGGAAALDVPGLDIDLTATAQTSPASGLLRALRAAEKGDRGAFDEHISQVDASLPFAPQRRDLWRVRAALDPALTLTNDDGCRAFRETQAPIPFGLEGLGAGDPGAPGAAVCVDPDQPPTRVLFLGAPLFRGKSVSAQTLGRQKIGRTEAALVTVCMAGPEGVPFQDFFRSVYGFEYEQEVHRGVLGVLIHRMRDWLDGVAELERDERVVVIPNQPFVVPDARTSRSVTAQMVSFLANRVAGSAQDARGSLGISLRSAQQALTDLVADGACERIRDGRKMTYQLTDTTFQDPTDMNLLDSP